MKRVVILSIIIAFLIPLGARAEIEGELTWSANSYIPPGYMGKALATRNSEITVALIGLNDGRIIDLNGRVDWFLNNRYFASGNGLTSITFAADEQAAAEYSVRATARDLSGAFFVSAITTIPVVRPQAIVAIPYPERKVPDSFRLVLLPYFFSLVSPTSLSVEWSVLGQALYNTFSPEIVLGRDGAAGEDTLAVSLRVDNPFTALESVAAQFLLKTGALYAN